MAITLNSHPDDYSSFHESLWFVVSSTNVTQPNFKFVCDVYINGTIVKRLKAFPVSTPTGQKGIFDIASIIRNYWSSYFKPTVTVPTAFSYMSSDIIVGYQLKFGEEYGGTTYLNTYEDDERFAYNYYVDYLRTPTSNMYVEPVHYETMYAGFFLSNRDRSSIKFDKNSLQTDYLFISSLASAENTTIDHSFNVEVFKANGTTTYTSGSDYDFENFALLDISPRGLNNYFGSTVIGTDAVRYWVDLRMNGSETDAIYVDLVCMPYPSISLHFLNALGGYETFSFSAVNRQSRNIEKSKFETIEYQYIDGSMERQNSNGVLFGGNINFSTRQTLSYKLISDWVNEINYNWLKELIASPEVYMSRNNQFIPVDITTSSWSEKKLYNDKQFNLELDIQIGNKVNSQFR